MSRIDGHEGATPSEAWFHVNDAVGHSATSTQAHAERPKAEVNAPGTSTVVEPFDPRLHATLYVAAAPKPPPENAKAGKRLVELDPRRVKEEDNTIVCDGNGGIRLHVGKLKDEQKAACVDPCTAAHEESHRQDVLAVAPNICRNVAENVAIATADAVFKKNTEVRAYTAGVECLKQKRNQESANSACRFYVEAELQKRADTLQNIKRMTPEEVMNSGRY